VVLGNLNVHLVKELANFAEEYQDWIRIFQMPSCAPELNPAEGIWSLLKRHLADFAAADLTHLTRVIKRKLRKIQYRPHLVDGCPPLTGLTMDEDAIRPPESTSSHLSATPTSLRTRGNTSIPCKPLGHISSIRSPM
jgi:DDE superfamily endonuclease